MARVSTHVLDTSRGQPAAGIELELYILHEGEPRSIAAAVTNGDGRPNAPLLGGDHVEPGTYELRFHAAAYFKRIGVPLTHPPFLDVIVIRFGVSDPDGHYHVPLLLSPYGYSTYRGS
jgi:5-hydroxyisourate hydrolase